MENQLIEASLFPENEQICGVLFGQEQENSWHCGIVYSKENKETKVLHLGWHYLMQNDPINDSKFDQYIWVKSNGIHKLNQRSISGMCRLVALKGKNIPYATNFKETRFTDEGKLVLGENEFGLTCATFVLAIYKNCGINLIDFDSWKNRESDESWRARIIEMLKKTSGRFGISEEHISNVESEINCFRYSPVETAVSSNFKNLPVKMDDIIERVTSFAI